MVALWGLRIARKDEAPVLVPGFVVGEVPFMSIYGEDPGIHPCYCHSCRGIGTPLRLLACLREDTGQRRPGPGSSVMEAAGQQWLHSEPTSPLSFALVIFSEAVVTHELARRHPLSNARCSSQNVNPVFPFAFCLPGWR